MSSQNLLVAVFKCYIFSSICVGFSTANQMNSDVGNDHLLLRGRRDVDAASYFYYQEADYPKDCQEVYNQCTNTTDGIYLIKPDGYAEPFEVFCNNTIDGGGWTVFQRRKYGDVNFHRNWVDYKNGFGFLHRDFWLGNDKLAYLTNQKDYELRIDLVSSSLVSRFAHYNLFRISDVGTKYKLVGLGNYSGNSGYNSFNWNSGDQFSTHDQDNDISSSYHCATNHRGGWWYVTDGGIGHCYRSSAGYRCSDSNLNGNFGENGAHGVFWRGLPGSYCNVRYTEMKIRPVQSN